LKNFDNSFGQFVLKDFFNGKAESKIGSFGSISKRNLNDASNFSSLSLSIGGGVGVFGGGVGVFGGGVGVFGGGVGGLTGGGVGGLTGGGDGGLTIEGLAGGLGRKYL
jgi:hypothetical protein